MKSKNILSLSSILLFITIIVGCDFEPKDVSYFVWEEEEFCDGRNLKINTPDTICIDVMPDSLKRFDDCGYNLFCTDAKDLQISTDSIWEENFRNRLYFPIYVHRFSGRIDTLYKRSYLYSAGQIEIGYVSGEKSSGNWLVVQSKKPGLILGYDYLSDKERFGCDKLSLYMWDYSYEGQEKVFASDNVYYWIASRNTTDIYGPLTLDEIKAQMRDLGVPLPFKLDGRYDRYTYCRDSNGNILPQPKAFRWPNHRKRDGTLIE